MILFGGDYNPEQWPERVWAEDVELMRAARVNLVTVGVFAWSALEPAPGEFDFRRLDRILALLGGAGIGVCLATPTASPPPWFTRLHPEAMPVTADNVRLTHGSRDTYCVNAPAYRAAGVRIAQELADRYATHEAVQMWHVHNEYGTTCFCDHCAAAFRVWLAGRYGDLGALNEAWCTEFWSQRYGDFADVLPPRATQYLHNPAQVLDYRRFVSDAMLGHYREQREILRVSPAPVTTNFVLGGWVPVDHARWAHEVDIVAVDDYPSSVDERAFSADRARGWALAAGCPWMVMEHAPAAGARATARIYLDRGAAGVMYFQWRASPGGAEQWHPAMTQFLPEIAEISGQEPVTVQAESAVLYDEQTMWAWQSPHLPDWKVDYEATVRRWHAAIGPPVDVLPVTAPLDRYTLVVAPALYLMSAATHAALREFAANGGTLVLTYASGLVDEVSRTTPGSLDDVIGGRVRRHQAAGARWIDDVEPVGAAVLLRTADGRPAITEHRYGAGIVRYLATDLDGL
jgi:beta-galactosidase